MLIALVAVLLSACGDDGDAPQPDDDGAPQMGMRVEGDPIQGGEITVFLTGPGGNPATVAVVTVNGEPATPDAQGGVLISVPLDATTLVIEAAQGQAEGTLEIEVLSAGETEPDPEATQDEGPQMGMRVEGEPIQGGEITVFLTGPGGNPATAAVVTVNGEPATPDAQGGVPISIPLDATKLTVIAAQGGATGTLEIDVLPVADPEPTAVE